MQMGVVGRFYYRRPNAESSADVFDRVSAFWDTLLGEGPTSLLMDRPDKYDTALLVTHGLTIRLLLMAVFQWSVWTFESVYNLGNCEHITLVKSMDKQCYEMSPTLSNPPCIPWATRNLWLRLKSLAPKPETLAKLAAVRGMKQMAAQAAAEASQAAASESGEGLAPATAGAGAGAGAGATIAPAAISWPELDKIEDELELQAQMESSKPFTVLEYLTLKPPRSMQHKAILKRLVPGHRVRGTPGELRARALETRIDPDDVLEFDWWGPSVSHRAKKLHIAMDRRELTSKSLDVSAGGRTPALKLARLDSTGGGGFMWGQAR